MPKKTKTAAPRPSELELQVLGCLWRDGPLTVREVLDRAPGGKERAYTTILTVMQVMEKKGLVTHTRRGAAYVYKPAISRRQALGPIFRGLMKNVFGGNPSEAVLHLLDECTVTDDEMKKIRDILKEYEPNKS